MLLFFRWLEVTADKNFRHQTCCLYVFSYNSPLPCQGLKSNLHHLWKMSARKHNARANSQIAYWLRKATINTINQGKLFDRRVGFFFNRQKIHFFLHPSHHYYSKNERLGGLPYYYINFLSFQFVLSAAVNCNFFLIFCLSSQFSFHSFFCRGVTHFLQRFFCSLV